MSTGGRVTLWGTASNASAQFGSKERHAQVRGPLFNFETFGIGSFQGQICPGIFHVFIPNLIYFIFDM